MPRSPFTLLLLILTLVAFAAHLLGLDDDGWIAPACLGVGIILLAATTILAVRDGAAFDDRAFHRTRPRGEARAFRNASLTLPCVAFLVALMAAWQMLYLNLGWQIAVWRGVTMVLPLLLCTAAVATAATLISARDRRRWLAAVLMLVPVLAVDLWVKEGGGLGPARHDWPFFFTLSWAGIAGTLGYGLSWLLAARFRKWWPALALATLTGAAMPLLHRQMPFRPWTLQPLPEAKLVITRNPPAKDPLEARIREEARSRYAEMPAEVRKGHSLYVPIFLRGRFMVQGLREDEYIQAHGLIPGGAARKDRNSGSAVVGQGILWKDNPSQNSSMDDELFLTAHPSPVDNARQALIDHLVTRLPQPAHLESNPARREIDWLQVDEQRNSIGEIEGRDWQINGVVYRWEEAGNFDLAKGGRHRLSSGGVTQVWPYYTTRLSHGITFRMVQRPEYDLSSASGASYYSLFPKALLRDPVTGRTRVLGVNPAQGGGGYVLGWQNYAMQLDRLDDIAEPDEEESILRSRLYLFIPRPVARVKMTLPPPPR